MDIPIFEQHNRCVWLNGDLSIRTGHTLTLAPGVKIKGGEYKSIYVNGRLIAEGAQDTPIIFTSEKDDTVCGVGAANEAVCDTNNDGAKSVPASGDSGSIHSTLAATPAVSSVAPYSVTEARNAVIITEELFGLPIRRQRLRILA